MSVTGELEPLAAIEDLEAALGRPIGDEERPKAELMLEAASAALRRMTGQTLSLAESTERHDGWRSRLLQLDEIPVVDVESVEVEGREVDPALYRIDYRAGLLWSWGWWAGRQGIEVRYSHGFDPLPADLLLVLFGMVGRALSVPDAGDVRSERLGPYSYDRGPVVGLGAVGLTAAESSVIARYRQRRQVVQ